MRHFSATYQRARRIDHLKTLILRDQRMLKDLEAAGPLVAAGMRLARRRIARNSKALAAS